MEGQQRPLGVTIIAILTIIGGILLFLSGLSLLVIGTLVSVTPSGTSTIANSHPLAQVFGVISVATGSVLLVIGIGYLVMFYGLLKGKRWAWTITLILLLIGIAIQIISSITGSVINASLSTSTTSSNSVIAGIAGGLIGIAINVVIIYYLYRPHVKAFFGKNVSPTI
jgi:uncharacterized membrane protein